MLVQQALYGDDGGGHALLLSSIRGDGLFAELAGRTDLPGTAPPGVPWEPYLSGFPHGRHYVLVKTLPDATASRGGMVLSHALFLPLDEAIHLTNMRPLRDLLIDEVARPAVLTPAAIHPTCNEGWSDTGTSGLGDLADSLVAHEVRLPVVWMGQHGFTEAMMVLWERLRPEFRRWFRFRLSFGPQDCHEPPPTVVCTPLALESRWAGHRVVSTAGTDGPRTEAAQCLLGLPGGQRLADFGHEIAVHLSRFADLSLLEKCRTYAADEDPTADERLALVRLLGRLSPRPGEGDGPKRRAVVRLAEAVRTMRAAEVIKLRNLELSAFPDPAPIRDALSEWAEGYAIDRAGADSDVGSVLGAAALSPPVASHWKEAILRGFDRAASSPRPAFAVALWTWWKQHPASITLLGERLPQHAAMGEALAASCPTSLGRNIAEAVLPLAVGRGWLCLHGACAAAAFDTATALARQMTVDTNAAHAAGIEAVLRRASGSEIVAATIRWGDPRLIDAAANACVSEPTLLRGLDPGQPTWRAIWAAAMDRDADAWMGPAEPHTVVGRLLDREIAGEGGSRALWAALARTPLGDLSDRPARGELWRRLPTEVRSLLLESTAAGWLQRFRTDPAYDPDVETELRSAVLQEPRLGEFLRLLLPSQLGIGMQFFLRFSELPEARFESWLAAVVSGTSPTRSLLPRDATLLGRLVRSRGWRQVTGQIVDGILRGGRHDLRPALDECHPLIGLWDRARLSWSGVREWSQPNTDDLWRLLEQVAVELYPKGPEDHSLWRRAGGGDSSLRHDGTGLVRWHDALRLLRHGGDAVTAGRLLEVMRHDYPRNERLSWLATRGELQDRTKD